jgi:hypothetical protein
MQVVSPVLLYGSDIWTVRQKWIKNDGRRSRWNLQKYWGIQTHFDHKWNEEILEELKVELPVDNKLRRNKANCLQHLTGMNSSNSNSWMRTAMLNYRPNGWRRHGSPLKRLLDEGETGRSRRAVWRMMTAVLLWAVMRRVVVILYRHFCATYLSLLQGPITLEDGTDRLSWNVGKELALHAA